uniref:Glutamate receptor n=1 Tax=Hucho hucho TaxID=62062 RepID=A0A4W5PUD8_9TELE
MAIYSFTLCHSSCLFLPYFRVCPYSCVCLCVSLLLCVCVRIPVCVCVSVLLCVSVCPYSCEAELAVASLTLTATREQGVEMSTPFMQTGISFILSRDMGSEESHSLSFLFPFSTDMWVGILLAFLVTGLCIYLVTRISPCEWADPETDEHSFTLLHSFWYITGALTLQGAGPHPKGLSGRVISAVWWVFAVVLLACYFSNFNAMLRSDSKHVSVNNFEDLAKQDVIDYGTVEGGSTFNFFKNSNNPTYRRIYQHMERKKSCVASVEEGNRRTQEGNYAFIGEAASLDLAVARYCNLIRSSELIAMRGYSIAAPLGEPLAAESTVPLGEPLAAESTVPLGELLAAESTVPLDEPLAAEKDAQCHLRERALGMLQRGMRTPDVARAINCNVR